MDFIVPHLIREFEEHRHSLIIEMLLDWERCLQIILFDRRHDS